jgi:hypothetical protein
MEEQNAGTIKKIGAGNKSLSVIVAEDKLAKFKKFSQGINLSMGYLLNQAIDRYLATDTTDIFKSSIGVVGIPPNPPNIVNPELGIEELIKTSIDSYLLNHPIGISTPPPISLSRADVEDIVNTSIGHLGLDEIIKSSIGVSDVERIVNTSIGLAIEPITQTITELETYTRGRFEELEALSIEKPKPAKTTTKKLDNEPEWVDGDNRRFYKLFVQNPDLMGEVAEAIDLHSDSNAELSKALKGMGIHKQDGTAHPSEVMSRIKKVVTNLTGEPADNAKQ